ncbi:F0F1 ATP synthase subunit epsilon [Pontibacterium granulatum]|uniref:F0F1 ATP synthase subunit epsilon n=1 Tax=Pontibacterium granulatum TaxID=2036029 RepID=UPI00249A549D|nr:F0F1 ATP synthase subunit epsilon [Pontibacterium granulatum]MDI3325628.1 F0F1 ATP synthase subunit epsilon [Pontibacterium granulatum]
MKSFTLRLQDATQSLEMKGITSFVGEDASGSFGILAGHARMMTSLVIGMARFYTGKQWQFIAVPGALLYFNNNILTLSTRRYLVDDNYERISDALQQQILVEEEKLRSMKNSLYHMEEEMLKRLWATGRSSSKNIE